MSIHSPIQYLTQPYIDKDKWDACLDRASNRLLYGYSFYLDAMSKHWHALVLNDYEAVMPLTWNKKYGISYLYQPFCCAMLGVFGSDAHAEMIEDFLRHIPGKYRYWDIYLNPRNVFHQGDFNCYDRKNYIVPLNAPHAVLFNKFSDNTKRNIKKSGQLFCTVTKPALAEVLALAKIQLQQFARVSNEDFNRFTSLYQYLAQRNAATTYGIVTADGILLSSCVFFNWQNRAYYILAGNHPSSRSTGASHALINAFIKDHANTNMILDFEGSDIPGLAQFYSSFGATEEKYPGIHYNRLPNIIKWLKK